MAVKKCALTLKDNPPESKQHWLPSKDDAVAFGERGRLDRRFRRLAENSFGSGGLTKKCIIFRGRLAGVGGGEDM